jgi:hypothetical protein
MSSVRWPFVDGCFSVSVFPSQTNVAASLLHPHPTHRTLQCCRWVYSVVVSLRVVGVVVSSASGCIRGGGHGPWLSIGNAASFPGVF